MRAGMKGVQVSPIRESFSHRERFDIICDQVDHQDRISCE